MTSVALIDQPPREGVPPLWSLEGVLAVDPQIYGPTLLKRWDHTGFAGALVELPDVYCAAAWARVIRPNVFRVQIAKPVTDLYRPTELMIILLDTKRKDFATWHREHCEDSCFMCHVKNVIV